MELKDRERVHQRLRLVLYSAYGGGSVVGGSRALLQGYAVPRAMGTHGILYSVAFAAVAAIGQGAQAVLGVNGEQVWTVAGGVSLGLASAMSSSSRRPQAAGVGGIIGAAAGYTAFHMTQSIKQASKDAVIDFAQSKTKPKYVKPEDVPEIETEDDTVYMNKHYAVFRVSMQPLLRMYDNSIRDVIQTRFAKHQRRLQLYCESAHLQQQEVEYLQDDHVQAILSGEA